MGRFKYVGIIAGVLVVVFALVLAFWHPWGNAPNAGGQDSLAVSTLWNPQALSIEDWQYLRSPRQIIVGPPGEIFFSDRSRGHVIRLTTGGKLIEVVGGPGQGPGEFVEPTDLLFEAESSILWVVDRSFYSRVSRFRVSRTQTEFMDTQRSSTFMGATQSHGLALRDTQSMWFAPRIGSDLLQLLSMQEGLIDTRGDLWMPEGISPGSIWIYNERHLVDSGRDHFFLLWRARPIVEKWSKEGELVLRRELSGPAVQALQDRELAANEVRMFIRCATYDPSLDRLSLVLRSHNAAYALMVLEAESLKTIDVKYIPQAPDMYLVSIAANPEREGEYFGIDFGRDVLVRIHPR